MVAFGLIGSHPVQDAELHVFHRIKCLCEMPRDWSGLFRLEFLNTAVVFRNPISNRSFGFSSVTGVSFF